MERRAKIVATLGPASQDAGTIDRLIAAGMNVTRLNFSHGTHAEYAELIQRIRSAAERAGKAICILQDLQGPKIRVGELPKEGVPLTPGQTIVLATHHAAPNESHIPVDFPELPRFIQVGGIILLDDGNLELKATKIDTHTVETEVIVGGVLKSHKGMNLPGTSIDIPGLTAKDEQDLAKGLELGVDIIAISFVRNAADVARARQAIANLAPDKLDTPIIAKLERAEALENLHEIIEVADGVMVARGDLGVELPPEMVPIAQKQIIDAANQQRKLVITATQMLDSMIHNPRPTRAEASDVANAIFDGTDAVMLSGETAVGKYPVETVTMMDAIVRQAENHIRQWGHWKGSNLGTLRDDAISITRAANELAQDVNVAAITVFTSSGRTARLMSKAFPRVPILGLTPEPRSYNRMALYWGVMPIMVDLSSTVDEMLESIEGTVMRAASLKPGQQVVLTSGYPIGAMRPPNLVMIYTLGQRL
ncbi:MAG: pyruvate kinase [Anaerolineales bacterium]|nr:pyruvate kinase [Anaerolineales bacterium]MCW5854902.1 pyruvate kinase [Anaerolineales bacterium]MCW5878789.1 pyruvate kinase [Anaerolineales bacterium]